MKPAPEPTVSLSKGAPPIIKSWEKAIIDLGKSLPISCLCCGQMVTPEISAVWKSENPDAVDAIDLQRQMDEAIRPGEELVRRVPLDQPTIHALNRHERRKAAKLNRKR